MGASYVAHRLRVGHDCVTDLHGVADTSVGAHRRLLKQEDDWSKAAWQA